MVPTVDAMPLVVRLGLWPWFSMPINFDLHAEKALGFLGIVMDMDLEVQQRSQRIVPHAFELRQ